MKFKNAKFENESVEEVYNGLVAIALTVLCSIGGAVYIVAIYFV